MSRREQPAEYIINYMNKILINPLADIMNAVGTGNVLTALNLMYAYIWGLPTNITKGLHEEVESIESFMEKFYGISGRNYAHTGGLRLQLLGREGGPLMRSTYKKLFPLLYNKRLFDWRNVTTLWDSTGGRTSDDGVDYNT